MNKYLLISLMLIISINGFSQNSSDSVPKSLLKELANNGCKCVDSIEVYNKAKAEIAHEITDCISKQTNALQMGSKLLNIGELTKDSKIVDGKKEVNISINTEENSSEYKKYHYQLERYMMENCESLKTKIATNEKQSAKSVSKNSETLKYYNKGIDEAAKENYKKAADYFEKAVKIDPEFAFAYDNLGLNYRKLNNYDKAIEAYEKSLALDPNGLMPLQNIAVVYEYKKEYKKAVEAYGKLKDIDPENPEIYYGIGNVYATKLNELELGLENMCQAYLLYIEQKSPYRTDAEHVINVILTAMKKEGKEDVFNNILDKYKISRN